MHGSNANSQYSRVKITLRRTCSGNDTLKKKDTNNCHRKPIVVRPTTLSQKLLLRELGIRSIIGKHDLFNRRIPRRLCYSMRKLQLQAPTSTRCVFLGFSNEDYLISYRRCNTTGHYFLQWWSFSLSNEGELQQYREIRLFNGSHILGQGVNSHLQLFIWKSSDKRVLLIVGIPLTSNTDKQCFATICLCPSAIQYTNTSPTKSQTIHFDFSVSCFESFVKTCRIIPLKDAATTKNIYMIQMNFSHSIFLLRLRINDLMDSSFKNTKLLHHSNSNNDSELSDNQLSENKPFNGEHISKKSDNNSRRRHLYEMSLAISRKKRKQKKTKIDQQKSSDTDIFLNWATASEEQQKHDNLKLRKQRKLRRHCIQLKAQQGNHILWWKRKDFVYSIRYRNDDNINNDGNDTPKRLQKQGIQIRAISQAYFALEPFLTIQFSLSISKQTGDITKDKFASNLVNYSTVMLQSLINDTPKYTKNNEVSHVYSVYLVAALMENPTCPTNNRKSVASIIFAINNETGAEYILSKTRLRNKSIIDRISKNPGNELRLLALQLSTSVQTKSVVRDAHPLYGLTSLPRAKMLSNKAVIKGESVRALQHPRLPIALTL